MFAYCIGGIGDILLQFVLLMLAVFILTRGIILNRNNRKHHLVEICFALAIACLSFGIVDGSVAVISAMRRIEKGPAESFVMAFVFLRPIIAYGSASIVFSLIAGIIAISKKKE